MKWIIPLLIGIGAGFLVGVLGMPRQGWSRILVASFVGAGLGTLVMHLLLEIDLT